MRVTTHAREFRRLYRFKGAGQPLPADVASKLSGGISSNFHRTATATRKSTTIEIVLVGECLDGGKLLLHVIDVIAATATCIFGRMAEEIALLIFPSSRASNMPPCVRLMECLHVCYQVL